MLLRHALGNPDDVAVLLLLEAEERIEDAEAELTHEAVHVHFSFLLEKLVLDGLVARIRAGLLKQRLVLLFVNCVASLVSILTLN